MILKGIILTLICFVSLNSCADYNLNKKKSKQEKLYYSSSGFALIYEEDLFLQKVINNKIDNNEIKVMHSFLKKNTRIKIINPINSKSIETKIYKMSKYPKIFNVVISKKVASILELDLDNPYLEIVEVKKNKVFIAKKSNMFDEEKIVAEKVPVDEIVMDDLSKNESDSNNEISKRSNFVLVVNDFYYEESAINLKKDLTKKTKMNNISIKKINNNKYRLLVGPFKNFNALKTTYISLNNLGFEISNIKID